MVFKTFVVGTTVPIIQLRTIRLLVRRITIGHVRLPPQDMWISLPGTRLALLLLLLLLQYLYSVSISNLPASFRHQLHTHA